MTIKPVLIGIAGGTGSGKTSVARAIRQALPAGACSVIEHDSYYKDLSHLPFEQRVQTNFDHPDSLDNELLSQHLEMLRRGIGVDKPVYDFKTHSRTEATERSEPSPVIVVEGILVLADAQLRNRLDVKIFVDTDADVRMMRRIRRDIEERGRTFEDIRVQYNRTVRPMHIQFVEPSRRFADLIVPEGGRNTVAIGLMVRAFTRCVDEVQAGEFPDFQGKG
jgi:uridine kinase